MATAYGPNGMNKMVINHLEKLFVTNDAATIIRELEVEHPAAKMMILGSQMMEQEVVPMEKVVHSNEAAQAKLLFGPKELLLNIEYSFRLAAFLATMTYQIRS